MMAQNTAGVLAVELLCAAQGFDFRRPLRSSEALEAAHATIRTVAPRYDRDRYMAPDLSALQGLILKGAFA
jgi:histidine ammonia-lyase